MLLSHTDRPTARTTSGRLTVSVLVAATSLLRWVGREHPNQRAYVVTDPYER